MGLSTVLVNVDKNRESWIAKPMLDCSTVLLFQLVKMRENLSVVKNAGVWG